MTSTSSSSSSSSSYATTSTTTNKTSNNTSSLSPPSPTSHSHNTSSLKAPHHVQQQYRNKVMLAPMVRSGLLPLRLAALRHGADVVYGEELVAAKLVRTERVENVKLNTVDYVAPDGAVVYRTCPEDKPSILQIGAPNPSLALEAARHVEHDVDGIDVNLCCPKKFSLQGGMGAALLRRPDAAVDVMRSLAANISKPVTCKIRLLDSIEGTVDLVRRMEDVGVAAVAVHARYVPQRTRQPAHMDAVRTIQEAVTIPIIGNGDIFTEQDVRRVPKETGCSSVMLARGALRNISIFGKNPVSKLESIREYLTLCDQYETPYPPIKYTLLKMLEDDPEYKSKYYADILHSKTMKEACNTFQVTMTNEAFYEGMDQNKKRKRKRKRKD